MLPMRAANYSQALEAMVQTMRISAHRDPLISNTIGVSGDTGAGLDAFGQAQVEFGRLLERCTPMFWSEGPTSLVLQVSTQVERSQVMHPDLMYCSDAWCWFERPVDFWPKEASETDAASQLIGAGLDEALHREAHEWNQRLKLGAISWSWGSYDSGHDDQQEGLFIAAWAIDDSSGQYVAVNFGFVPSGAPVSACMASKIDAEPIMQAAQFIISAGAFMRSKISQTTQTVAERHARKRLARSAWTGTNLIDVVLLRQREHNATDGHSLIEWQHQWIVRAHTRQQWYPSKQAHLPVIIAPYLKGPEDKPIKIPSHKIFAVTR